MWGIIPAAGAGSRIQPLAFSKELLPVGCRIEGDTERPRAVSEYIIERMIRAGADRICFVISPGKSDILAYYGASLGPAHFAYVVQARPAGLCDAVFSALPILPADDHVFLGLPDTVWFPVHALQSLPDGVLSLLLFPVERPEFFDAVITGSGGEVQEVQVKQPGATSHQIWGAMKMPVTVLRALHRLWVERQKRDEFLGTLINAYLAGGGRAVGVPAGHRYVDIGTLHGYRSAIQLLSSRPPEEEEVTGPALACPAPARRVDSILQPQAA